MRTNTPMQLLLAMLALQCAAPLRAQVTHPLMRVRADTEIARLRQHAQVAPAVDAYDPVQIPAPLRRYFAYTGADRAVPARWARFRFTGEVRIPLTGDRQAVQRATPWMTAEGVQEMAMSVAGLGYVWDSRWRSPAGGVDVRDLYLDGETHVWAIRDDGRTLIDEQHGELARTYMIRFFAEATQSPTMLLPGKHLRWEAVDDTRARAVMRDHGVEARMVCSFDPEGALTECESEDRLLRYSGDVAERWIPARWVMTRSDYREQERLRLPTRMSVSWRLPGGEFEQLRAAVETVSFEVPGP